MKDSLVLRGSELRTRFATPALNGFARPIMHRLVSGLREGRLTVIDSAGRAVFGVASAQAPDVTLRIADQAFYGYALFRGSVGVGESYVLGHWDTDDLPGLVRLFVRNREQLAQLESGLARLSQPFYQAYHALRRNTVAGSRTNIQSHYDLGNAFYALFLDNTWCYSAGLYEREDSTLEEASRAKLARIALKLDLRPEHHLLEIGSGWGSQAILAAKEYGCRVTTVTLSTEQATLARARAQEAGVADRVDVRVQDYRELAGRFDRIVSVEMVEAVGHQYLDSYLQRCSDLLTDDGRMVLQSITMGDQYYARARDGVDFIKRYIFPGSCIPSVAVLASAVARVTDLRMTHLEDITPHYARTLADWRARFLANKAEARALGYSEQFLRLWDYYLAYCEGGFRERFIGDVQLVLDKPRYRGAPMLGALDSGVTRTDLA